MRLKANTRLALLLATLLVAAEASAQTVTIAYPAEPDSSGLRAIVKDAFRELLRTEPELLTNALRDGQTKEANSARLASATAAVQTAAKVATDPQVPAIGPANGKVVIEFFDYNCPHCKTFAEQTFAKVQDSRKDVRWLFVYAPILGPGSQRLAEFAAAAQLQGKFAAAHAFLIARKGSLATPEAADAIRDELIKTAGLDRARFDQAIAGGAAKAIVDHHMAYVGQAHLSGTPMLVTGTTYIPGFVPADVLMQHIG